MTKREEVIVQLLERFSELVDPMQMRAAEGDGTGLLLMPATYTPSVRELERLLIRMRSERRSQWWHVTERYIRCQRVQRVITEKRRTKAGKTVMVPVDRIVTSWHPGVRQEKVRRGVAWLADNWRLGHEPMIPKELLVAA